MDLVCLLREGEVGLQSKTAAELPVWRRGAFGCGGGKGAPLAEAQIQDTVGTRQSRCVSRMLLYQAISAFNVPSPSHARERSVLNHRGSVCAEQLTATQHDAVPCAVYSVSLDFVQPRFRADRDLNIRIDKPN